MKNFLTPIAVSSLFLLAPQAHAELPIINEKPFLGYFVGYLDRKIQFGITAKGDAILFPLKKDGTVQSIFKPIKINYEILETNPDGTSTSKFIQSESLTSEQPAAVNPKKPAVISGKVTGDAAFQLACIPERGGFSLTGKITDKGKLTNPLRFAITIAFDPYEGSTGGSNEKEQEAFAKKLKRDEFRLKTVSGKREKIAFMESLNPAVKFAEGFTEAELKTEGYDGTGFQFLASGDSKITFEDNGSGRFYQGFTIIWSIKEGGDPSKSKLTIIPK